MKQHMAKADLTDADLDDIEFKAGELLELMRIATDKLQKMRADKLKAPGQRAKLCAVYAREASNLGVFLLNTAMMQDQHDELERLKAAQGGQCR